MTENRERSDGKDGRRLNSPTWTVLVLGALALLTLALVVPMPAAPAPEEGPVGATRATLTYNALDYQSTHFDFRRGRFLATYQIDERYRAVPGDVEFDGRHLTIIANDETTGVIVHLGQDKIPDNEFSLFYGLRQFKRHLQLRRYPIVDEFRPFDGFKRDEFFGRPTDERLSVSLELGHTYLLRLMHRTRLQDERIYVLRVVDLVPGVKGTLIWRQLGEV